MRLASFAFPFVTAFLAVGLLTPAAFAGNGLPGTACSAASDCGSNFCVDGVCCLTACTGACNACSIAKGALLDGTCTGLTNVPCDDGNACTQGDMCAAGVCVPGFPKTCTPSDQCHSAGTCDSTTGACSNPPVSDGTTCNDGSLCTTGDTCQAGVCKGTAKTCTALDQCHVPGTCDGLTGLCSNPAAPNLTPCDDGDLCTPNDSCSNGLCVPGGSTICTSLDPCKTSACLPSTGKCVDAPKVDGTACDDDDECTQTDTCQSGSCVGGNPVKCSAKDSCHDAGTCDKQTGVCSDPDKTDGTACDDGSACTKSDSCQAGLCTGTAPVFCAPPDQCQTIATCDTASGTCTYTDKADGTPCEDGDLCTTGDTCQAGACKSGKAVTCKALDECHQTGICDSDTGTCLNPAVAEGTACSAGVCSAGQCGPAGTNYPSGGEGGAKVTGDSPKPTELTAQGGSCSATPGSAGGAAGGFALLGLGLAVASRRRRSGR